MATYLENLEAARASAAEALAKAMASAASGDSASAGGAPNSPAGIDHEGHVRKLRETLGDIDRLIAAAGGPVEITTQGIT